MSPSASHRRTPHGLSHRLAVVLAPGALDKLRRSSEFRRLAAGDGGASGPGTVYVHDTEPVIRVTLGADTARALVEVTRRP